MSDVTVTQGDTAPDLKATLSYSDGDPVDLTGASVRFQMRRPDDRRYTVNGEATIEDENLGKVSYSWGPNDLAFTGEFQGQWEVTFPDSRVQTSDPPNTITVRRQ